MKKTKLTLSFFLASMLMLTACKKEKLVQAQKKEIRLANLSDWTQHATFINKTEASVTEEEYAKINAAIGGIIVRFTIGNKETTLPAAITTGDHITTYYYKWVEKTLTIYMQKNKVVLEVLQKPGEARLEFYVLE